MVIVMAFVFVIMVEIMKVVVIIPRVMVELVVI